VAPPLNVISLFSGVGGLDLGFKRAVPDARTVLFVERETYACEVLATRMEEGALDPAPIWTDVTTFDGRPWRGVVDCVIGGFPCQDISNAGKRQGIIEGNRSGLWFEYARIIDEVRPSVVFIENVAALARRGLDIVLRDLTALGFDAEWGVYSAAKAGAPHRRDRLFILAWRRVSDSDSSAPERRGGTGVLDSSAGRAEGEGDRRAPDASNDRIQALADDDDAGFAGERRELSRHGDAEHGHDSHGRGGPGAQVGNAHGIRECQSNDEATPQRDGRQGPRQDTVRAGGRLVGVAHEQRLEGRGVSERGRSHERAPWPPGPTDAVGWAEYLERWPDLAPAVEATAKPTLRRGADGLANQPHGAMRMPPPCLCNRVDRLRACGNGVVPDQAALAFRELAGRIGGAGFLRHSGSQR
jgi:DNA (cytosine-5)-methyltransferase 1